MLLLALLAVGQAVRSAHNRECGARVSIYLLSMIRGAPLRLSAR